MGNQPGTIDTLYGVVAYDDVDVKNAIVAYLPISHDNGAQAVLAAGSPPIPSQHCRVASFDLSLVITFLGTPSQTVNVFASSINGFAIDSTDVQFARSLGKLR
jgi:hypothetical protein